MSRRRSIASLPVLAALLGAPAGTSAQPAPAAPASAADPADAAFRQGNALYKQQRYAEAKAAFEQAFKLKRSHDIAANLGFAELKLGLQRDAAEHLAFAVKNWPPTGKAENRESALHWLGIAKGAVMTLKVTVNVDGATVLVDGKAVGTSPLETEVFVDPGTRTIGARLAGYADAEHAVQATQGGEQKVEIALVAAPPPGPAGGGGRGPTPPPTPARRSVVPGAVLGGVGGAALVTGIGLIVAGAGKLSTSKTESQQVLDAHKSCVAGATNYDTQQCASLASTASTSDTLDRVGLGFLVGAGAAAVGSVVYFVWPAAKPSAPSAGVVHVVPSVSATGGGLVVSGTF